MRGLEGHPMCLCPRPASQDESTVLTSQCAHIGKCPHSDGHCSRSCVDLRGLRVYGMTFLSESFWKGVRAGFLQAANDLRVRAPGVFWADRSGLEQDIIIANLTEMVKRGYGLAEVSSETPIAEAVGNATRDHGLPLSSLNRDELMPYFAVNPQYLGHVGMVERVAGYMAGEYFIKKKNRKHLLMIQFTENGYAVNRAGGVMDAFEDAGLQVTRYLRWWTPEVVEEVRATITDYLTNDTSIDTIYLIWNYDHTAVDAADAVGLDPAARSIGVVDPSFSTLKFMREGKIDLLVDQQPFFQGWGSLMLHATYFLSAEMLRQKLIGNGRIMTEADVDDALLASSECSGDMWTAETVGAAFLPDNLPNSVRGYPVCPPEDCPPGYGRPLGQKRCRECVPGSYSFFNATAQICKPCPAGKLCGPKTAIGQTEAERLAAQKRWPERFAAGQVTEWADCPIGYFCPEGSALPQACLPGTYNAFAGQNSSESCFKCAVGHFGADSSADECTPCPAGMFSDSEGRTACSPCGRGTFQEKRGQSSCVDCQGLIVGSTTVLLGSAAASGCVCDRGFALSGSSYARPMQSTDEEPECLPCAEGWTCDGVYDEEFGYGQARLTPGYSSDTYEPSVAAFSCPGGAAACPGNGPPKTCSASASGINCAKCDPEYFLNSDRVCEACLESSLSSVWSALLLMAFASVLFWNITPREIDEEADREIYVSRLSVSGSMGLGISFLQLLWIVVKMPVDWPDSIKDLFEWPGALFELSFINFDCSFNSVSSKVVTLTVLPGIIPLLVVVEYAAGRTLVAPTSKLRPRLLRACNTMWSAYEKFFLLIVNNALNVVLAMDAHPNGELTSRSFPSMLRGSDEWQRLIPWSVLGLVLWCGGYVAATCYALAHRRVWPPKSRKHDCCLFVFSRFKDGYGLWGLVIMLRRVLIVASLSMFAKAMYQIMFITSTLAVAVALQAVFSPFRFPYVQNMDIVCMVIPIMFLSATAVHVTENSQGLSSEEAVGGELLLWVGTVCYAFLAGAIALALRTRYHIDSYKVQVRPDGHAPNESMINM